jgi:hypothetical protein
LATPYQTEHVRADQRHVLYVAIGSGLGAGIVIDGRLHRGAHADPERRLAQALRRHWRGHWPVEVVAGTLGRDDLPHRLASPAFATATPARSRHA